MPKGFDAARDCRKIIGKIQVAKLDFAARYYSHSPTKNLTAAEAVALSQGGINLVAIWESKGKPGSFFSHAQGVADGAAAYRQALQVGQPGQTPIYFAVDFDANQAELAGGINDYFHGVATGFDAVSHGKSVHSAGVYGSGLICAWLQQRGLATHTWLAGAMGWRGSKDYAGWNIKQGLPADPWNFGFKIDPDDAQAGYGGFKVPIH